MHPRLCNTRRLISVPFLTACLGFDRSREENPPRITFNEDKRSELNYSSGMSDNPPKNEVSTWQRWIMHEASPLAFKQFVCLFSAGDLVTLTVRTHSDLCCHSLIELQENTWENWHKLLRVFIWSTWSHYEARGKNLLRCTEHSLCCGKAALFSFKSVCVGRGDGRRYRCY